MYLQKQVPGVVSLFQDTLESLGELVLTEKMAHTCNEGEQ